LSFDEEIVGFDCLIRTDGGVDVVGLSSDFICRGGIGGGREFFFDSLSIERKQHDYTIKFLPYSKEVQFNDVFQ